MITQELATRLSLWNRLEVLQHDDADQFVAAFWASGDADDLEDDADAIDAACKALFVDLQARAE